MGVQPVLKLTPAQTFRALAWGGILGSMLLPWLGSDWLLSLVACFIAGMAAWRISYIRYLALVLVGAGALLARGAFLLPPPEAGSFVGPQTFEAKVASPPRASERVVRYIVEPNDYDIGLVMLVASPYPIVSYGERVHVVCTQVVAVTLESYHNRGIFRECAFPDVTSVAPPQPSLQGTLLRLREAGGTRIKQQLAEPYGSLTTGILWGDDAELPRSLVMAFRRTGTSHLLAVSGYNVMVLTEILFTVLMALGLWRRSASVIIIGLVFLFVIFTGAEPAVVRAGIMGSLLVVARLAGRRADKLNLLLGAAAAMLLVLPWLISDLGFQLSFAAMAGLLYLAPFLNEHMRFVPISGGWREGMAQAIAATISTLPIVLLRLQQLPILGVPANILVGPVVAAVFALGLPLLLLGWLVPALALPFTFALTAVLRYVTWVVESLAAIPWAQVVLPMPIAWLVAVTLAAVLIWWLLKRQRATI